MIVMGMRVTHQYILEHPQKRQHISRTAANRCCGCMRWSNAAAVSCSGAAQAPLGAQPPAESQSAVTTVLAVRPGRAIWARVRSGCGEACGDGGGGAARRAPRPRFISSSSSVHTHHHRHHHHHIIRRRRFIIPAGWLKSACAAVVLYVVVVVVVMISSIVVVVSLIIISFIIPAW